MHLNPTKTPSTTRNARESRGEDASLFLAPSSLSSLLPLSFLRTTLRTLGAPLGAPLGPSLSFGERGGVFFFFFFIVEKAVNYDGKFWPR